MTDILIAVIIDWIIGDPYGFPHPIIYIGKLIKWLEEKGRKICKTGRQLKFYGGFIVIIMCLVSFLIPFMILKLFHNNWLYHVANIMLLWTTLACKSLHKEGKKVYDSLKNNDIEDAKLKLSYIVGRDTKNLTEQEIIRADVETIAENTSDGVIAPLLFAVIGGAPLAMMYKAVNTMDSMLGYKNEKYKDIGFFPAKNDDLFNYIPSRVTGFILCLCAPIVRGSILKSLKIMIRDRKNHKSPNCAYPEGAVAGALGVQLGGTNVYFGEIVVKPTIGDCLKQISNENIIDTIKLMYCTEIVFILACILLEFSQRLW